jgi:Zn ribbon nucleic-acid-binding protein
MTSYWLIYTYKNKLTNPMAKRFDNPDDIQPWINERENIEVLDCVECSEQELQLL